MSMLFFSTHLAQREMHLQPHGRGYLFSARRVLIGGENAKDYARQQRDVGRFARCEVLFQSFMDHR